MITQPSWVKDDSTLYVGYTRKLTEDDTLFRVPAIDAMFAMAIQPVVEIYEIHHMKGTVVMVQLYGRQP